MFIQSLIKTLNTTYNVFNGNGIDRADPNLIKFFKTEYGNDWEIALQQHLYKKDINNDKKVA